ncbi:MAG: hypothetical protein M1814_006619 [Vezdaea aestivalis]|nr:MAG: hypothetical protein M1814_006619 [Vezdaea aestivalis]
MSSLLLLGALIGCSAASAPKTYHDNSPNCSCYKTYGPSSGQYQNYRFWDFRNISRQNVFVPTIESAVDPEDSKHFASSYFDTEAWKDDWGIQNWGVDATTDFPVEKRNSYLNVYIGAPITFPSPHPNDQEQGGTFLSFRTARQQNFQSVAEMETVATDILYASVRMKARVRGASGACGAIFTYLDETNEQDIEILTRDPKDVVRYTNQPVVDGDGDEIPQSSTLIHTPANYSDWTVHRLDWTPGLTTWYANSLPQTNKTYSVPKKASQIILNMWSDGGSWSGPMKVGDTAFMDVEWIELVYNTTADEKNSAKGYFGKDESCPKMCKVDAVNTVGVPEELNAEEKRSAAAPASGKLEASMRWYLGVFAVFVSIWIIEPICASQAYLMTGGLMLTGLLAM